MYFKQPVEEGSLVQPAPEREKNEINGHQLEVKKIQSF